MFGVTTWETTRRSPAAERTATLTGPCHEPYHNPKYIIKKKKGKEWETAKSIFPYGYKMFFDMI